MFRKILVLASLSIRWRYLAIRIGLRAKRDADYVGAASVDFLMYSGYVYMAYMWSKMSLEAHKKLSLCQGNRQFLQAKLHTSDFFFARVLPMADSHSRSLMACTGSLMNMPESSF